MLFSLLKLFDSSLFILHSSLLSLVADSLVADSLVALSHTAHHAQARANRRKDGDEGLNHNFPKFTFFHSSFCLRVCFKEIKGDIASLLGR